MDRYGFFLALCFLSLLSIPLAASLISRTVVEEVVADVNGRSIDVSLISEVPRFFYSSDEKIDLVFSCAVGGKVVKQFKDVQSISIEYPRLASSVTVTRGVLMVNGYKQAISMSRQEVDICSALNRD